MLAHAFTHIAKKKKEVKRKEREKTIWVRRDDRVDWMSAKRRGKGSVGAKIRQKAKTFNADGGGWESVEYVVFSFLTQRHIKTNYMVGIVKCRQSQYYNSDRDRPIKRIRTMKKKKTNKKKKKRMR